MKELSLNILDIAQNSVKAGASLIKIELSETDETLEIAVTDNGCGMTAEQVASVMDPFFTTRTTRNVGLGVPLLKMEAEQTGGGISIESSVEEDHGTVVKALFYKNHIDFIPLGDIVSTVTALIQGAPGIDWVFTHKKGDNDVELDTREIRAVLGEDVRLEEYEVIKWIEEYLKEGYDSFI